ncbi:MAG: TIGR02186 family protein [Alphaproteobacteria bacterium]|nr:TIGR02186 family protein [Alphaproteobacteria bacterium]
MSRQRALLRTARLIALLVVAATGPARADTLVADLTSHLIGITSGFTGASVVLFGATDGPGDIVVVVRGPDREMTVRRKGKVLGIWVNTAQVAFANVPSFYALAASRPVEEAIAPATAALYRIGVGNLRIEAKSPARPEAAAAFAQALIRQQQADGLFPTAVGKIAFLGERLFRTTISFPANVPTGTYLIEIFLVRDKDVVSGQTTPLVVSKVGLDAAVVEFAGRQAAIYGLIAVLMAMMAGWLASLPFRGI